MPHGHRYELLYFALDLKVRPNGNCATTTGGDFRHDSLGLRLRFVEVNGNVPSAAGKVQGYGATDPPSTPGDENISCILQRNSPAGTAVAAGREGFWSGGFQTVPIPPVRPPVTRFKKACPRPVSADRHPSCRLVMKRAAAFATPRAVMHKCSASTTTAAPSGSSTSTMGRMMSSVIRS